MVEVFGSSKRTINDYLQQLEEMQLLYVFRPKKRRTDGTFQNVNNSYGRYADKEKVMISLMTRMRFSRSKRFLIAIRIMTSLNFTQILLTFITIVIMF